MITTAAAMSSKMEIANAPRLAKSVNRKKSSEAIPNAMAIPMTVALRVPAIVLHERALLQLRGDLCP